MGKKEVMREKKPHENTNPFDRIRTIIEKIKGFENVELLNKYSRQITHYYKQVTLGDLKGDSYSFVDFDSINESEAKMKVADLFEAIRMGDTYAHNIILKSLRGQSVFHPLFTTILENFDDIDINKASSLMYLYNKIENPMQGATKLTHNFYDKAASLSRDKIDFSKVTRVQKNRVLADINELVVTMMVKDCAWSYFGQERAASILYLLEDPHYGPLLFADLFKLASDENKKILAPPQILSILLQISKDLFGDETVVFSKQDSAHILKKFYDNAGSLDQFKSNYSITSLDRVNEYDMRIFPNNNELTRIIKPEFRDGSIISIGGSIGLEALRTLELDSCSSPVMIIDPLGYDKALGNALVLKHEYKFESGDPRLSPQLIEEKLKTVPGGILFLEEKAPISYAQIMEKLAKSKTPFANDEERNNLLERFSNLQPKVIFDQRATGIYLEDSVALESIKNSLQILSRGGVYFFTRGYADKLIIDQVVEISSSTGKATLRHLHTTEPYSYFDTQELTSITGTGLAATFYRYPYKSDSNFNPFEFGSSLEREKESLLNTAREKTLCMLLEDSELDYHILYPFIELMKKAVGHIELFGDMNSLAKEFHSIIQKRNIKIFLPFIRSKKKMILITEDWCLKTIKILLPHWQIANQLVNDRHAEITARIISADKERKDRLTFIDYIAFEFKNKFLLSHRSLNPDEAPYDFTNIILYALFDFYGISYPINGFVRKEKELLMEDSYKEKSYILERIWKSIRLKILSIQNENEYNWDELEPLKGSSGVPINVVALILTLKGCADSEWKAWINHFNKTLGIKSHQAAD